MLIICFSNSEARRVCNVDIEQVFVVLFHLDSKVTEKYLNDLKNIFSEDPESFYSYMEEFKRLGSTLQLSDKNEDRYLHSIADDLIVLAENLNEIEGGFGSLMEMVLEVAEIKRNAYFIFRMMRSLDEAVKVWSDSDGLKKHFMFSMEKLVQLAAGSDLKGEDILSQLQIFFNQTKENSNKLECDVLVKDVILKNSGCYLDLSLLNSSNSLGVVSFDWGGVLLSIVDNLEIRQIVKNSLVLLRDKGIKCYILSEGDPSKIEARLEALDQEEGGLFWSEYFQGILHALPGDPERSKATYLGDIARDNPNSAIVHFDDSPSHMNLRMINNVSVVGVVAYPYSSANFEKAVSNLASANALIMNLGRGFSRLLRLIID